MARAGPCRRVTASAGHVISAPMSTLNPTHPYTLELSPSPKGDGSFGWAIRKNGKLLERSDRTYRSEQEATKKGEEALERTLKGESQASPARRR